MFNRLLGTDGFSHVQIERMAWVVVLFVLVGDVVTTVIGLHLGLNESNPVADTVIQQWGVIGMLVLKGFAVTVGLACRSLVEPMYRIVIPGALAVTWGVAVIVNVFMISHVLH